MKGRISMTGLAAGVFALLFLLTVVGVVRRAWIESPQARVQSHVYEGEPGGRLFFYVHGFPGHQHECSVARALAPRATTQETGCPVDDRPAPSVEAGVPGATVIGLRYEAGFSNTRPPDVAHALATEMKRQADARPDAERITLIGESMGALLLRRAFLGAHIAKSPWTSRVHRIVLLAGLNRGWDITGHKPSDMTSWRWTAMYLGTWLARLTDWARLAMGMESGSPFVANLRLDWMEQLRDENLGHLEVVQLRGDIDDLVSEEDSRDLDAVAHGKYASLRVRGTSHGSIGDFADPQTEGGQSLGAYRREKFLLAATRPFEVVKAECEQEPYQVDGEVTHVVFVLHGIRDLGQWATTFEHDLRREFEARPNRKSHDKLVIASVRYGYLGMGPFLLLAKRQHYVQWLMDEYTEVRARYPNARDIHFFGHSNGTYLLASALEQYPSLKIDRIAFGGSVVSKRYNWSRVFERRQVESVRNYAAADDWVVALFPRFFEPAFMRRIFANDLGSAGFNGFETVDPRVKNVTFIEGGHGAFVHRTAEISRYLLNADESVETVPTHKPCLLLKQGSTWATWFIVWPLLALVLAFVGWHVVMSSTEPRWPFILSYLLLVLFILKNA